MEIWFAYLRKLACCSYDSCQFDSTEVTAGTRVIRGHHKKNGFHFRFIWHIECYVAQGHVYLDDHPYVPYTGGPGRKKFNLSQIDRKKRKALITKALRIRKSKEEAISLGWLWKLPALENKMKKVLSDFQSVGGIPSHW